MISFSNQVLSVLLGWVRGLAASLWTAVSGGAAGSLLGWLSANWLGLTLLLCVIGLAADLIVYLLRWQPYKVFRSYIRRRRQRREQPRRTADPALSAPAPAAADGDLTASGRHRRVDKPRRAAPAWMERMTEKLSAQEEQPSLLRRRRVDTGIQRAEQFNEPYYPPQYRQPGDTGTITPRPRRRRGGGS